MITKNRFKCKFLRDRKGGRLPWSYEILMNINSRVKNGVTTFSPTLEILQMIFSSIGWKKSSIKIHSIKFEWDVLEAEKYFSVFC